MNMPRGSGARARRSALRVAVGAEVEGVSKAPDLVSASDTEALTDQALDGFVTTIESAFKPKGGKRGGGMPCANCDHLSADHDGACSMEGCSCEGFEAKYASAVEFTADDAGLSVSAFEPTADHVDAAVAALTADAPEAADIVRLRLSELRLRRFADEPVNLAPPLNVGDEYTLAWDAVLAPEGRMTDDYRAFAPGSITWRDLPLTLSAMLETAEGHDGARVCGKITRIWRDETAGLIRAEGEFDDGDYGQEIARMVAAGVLRGNSVDLAIKDVVYVPVADWFDADGNWAPREDAAEATDQDLVESLFDTPEQPMVYLIREAVIGMSTVVPFPAFAEGVIESGRSLAAGGSPFVWTLTHDAGFRLRAAKKPPPSLVASVSMQAATVAGEIYDSAGSVIGYFNAPVPGATPSAASGTVGAAATANLDVGGAQAAALVAAAPLQPPADWFDEPALTELTPLVVTADGRVYGHVAPWGSCHTGFPGVCVEAPRSETDYRFYHLKTVLCDDGTEVPVGTITLEAPHANKGLNLDGATAHYDHTGIAAADVRVGEDDFGIWVAGAARPGLSDEAIRELRGASLSGDWRNYEGNLELVGILAVNIPGFPIPRVAARVASGEMQTLVAAGVVINTGTVAADEAFATVDREESESGLTDFQMSVLRALASRDLADLAR